MTSVVPPDSDDGRTRELADRLAAVRARIAGAARDAGRDPDAVTLVAVTKFFPAADVVRLAGLGVTDVGENREQEASGKAADVAGLAGLAAATGAAGPSTPGPVPPGGLRWHMVGQLQTNKARAVARWAAVVESLDRARLVGALSRAALSQAADGGPAGLDVLVQVDLDPEPDPRRGGARPEDVPALADAVADADGLVLRGLMAVAPRGADPRPTFDRLAALAARVRADHPGADRLSAGMSADLEAAVAAGATHVRIGSALLGARPRPV